MSLGDSKNLRELIKNKLNLFLFNVFITKTIVSFILESNQLHNAIEVVYDMHNFKMISVFISFTLLFKIETRSNIKYRI